MASETSNQSDLGYLFCPLFRAIDCKWMAVAAFYEMVAQASLKAGQMLTKKQFLETGICCFISVGAIVELTALDEDVVMVSQPTVPQAPRNLRNNGGDPRRIIRGRG